MNLHMLFAIIALALFIAAAANVPSRIGLGWLGLFFLTLTILFV